MSEQTRQPQACPILPWVTVAVTSLGFALVQLDGSILNIALSQIGISLGTGLNNLQWTVDAYFVVFAVLLLSAGALSDRWGARRAFVSGFAVFSAASLACGVAPNIPTLIAARAAQGAGAALLVPCSLALLNGACAHDAGLRARAVGLWTAAGGVGIAAGPILGGMLVGFLGWRSIFFANLPIGMAGIWLALHFLDQPPRPEKRRDLDLTGQTLIALAIFGVVGAIIETGSLGWHAPISLYSIVLAFTAGAGFVIFERKISDPAIPIDLFRNIQVSTPMFVGFAVNAVMFGITFGFALYFQRVLSFSIIETGIAFLPFALMVTAANIIGGRSVSKFGLRVPMFAGLVVAVTGCLLLLGIDDRTTYLAILPGQLLVRLGIGLVVPAITTGTLAAVPSARSGVASGALNAVRQTGGALGVATFGALMAADMVQGVRVALAISCLLLLVVAILSLVGMAEAKEEHRSLPNSVRPRPAQ